MELAFYLSSLVAVITTLRVITHNQKIHALLYFILSLLSIACVFFSLGAHFAGALEIIIYASAIMVMFVFVVMIFNMHSSDNKKQELSLIYPRIWIGPVLISSSLLMIIINSIFKTDDYNIVGDLITAKNVGIALFGPYILVVELASILLLAALVVAFHFGKFSKNKYNNENMFNNKLIKTKDDTNIVRGNQS